MFSSKMVIFTGIWIFFALALPHDHPGIQGLIGISGLDSCGNDGYIHLASSLRRQYSHS